MDDFFATVSFDKTDDWRKCPATFEDPDELQMSAILKFNPNHEPAGSSAGGQFAHAEAWRVPKDVYAKTHEPEGEKLLTQWTELDATQRTPEMEEKVMAILRENRELRKEWDRQANAAVSTGKLTLEEFEKLGGWHGGGEKYGPLPPVLYHVTTAASDVEKHGLKTREELNQGAGLGLGGGTDDTISFATDRKVAEGIHSAMLLARDYMAGDVTPQDLIEQARERGFLEKMKTYIGDTKESYPGTDLHPQIYDLLHDTRTEMKGAGYTEEMLAWSGHNLSWGDKTGNAKIVARTSESTFVQRPATDTEKKDAKERFLKTWLAAREAVTGDLDPLFFGSNLQALGKVPRDQIQLMTFAPRSKKSMGYSVSSLAEWRTHTGKAVKRVKEQKFEAIFKFNPNHDPRTGQFTSGEGGYREPESPLGNAFQLLHLARSNNIPENEPISSLLDKLSTMAHLPRLDFVHKHGTPMEVENTDKPMTPHRCYNNSIDVMLADARDPNSVTKVPIEYVEGVVTEHGVPLSHAWNKEGPLYVDHTIGKERGGTRQYMGLIIPRRVLIPVASSGLFGKGYGEGIIGTILTMKDAKKRDRYINEIIKANQ
jgi:hypothetical protein